jgi:hypothetical protein
MISEETFKLHARAAPACVLLVCAAPVPNVLPQAVDCVPTHISASLSCAWLTRWIDQLTMHVHH